MSLAKTGFVLAVNVEGIFSGVEEQLKRLIDGTMDLIYKRGLLDGFLLGAVLVLMITSRRRQCCGSGK